MYQNHSAPKSLYAAFDTYPAPKGAAVHIREFATAIFSHLSPGLLLTLGNQELSAWQFEENAEIRRFDAPEKNYLKKALDFSTFVGNNAAMHQDSLMIAHFRDPWSGIPILQTKKPGLKTVYEVNALPSIELPARYPDLGSGTLGKIRALEQRCLQLADAIICPSEVIRKNLVSLGTDQTKITVISNGTSFAASQFLTKPPEAPTEYLIYFGAAQSWQGIEVLFRAMPHIRDLDNLKLVLCITASKARVHQLQKLADRCGISDRLLWLQKLEQTELMPWLQHAAISLAPLTECARNLVQGCCPLKIIESMAMGVPVIASDLPVTRELIAHNLDGWLTKADRPSELARAIRVLYSNPQACKRIGENARQKVITKLSWENACKKLTAVYDRLLRQ
jgi:glycosyltransferase involved in cell wall biosynthesis